MQLRHRKPFYKLHCLRNLFLRVAEAAGVVLASATSTSPVLSRARELREELTVDKVLNTGPAGEINEEQLFLSLLLHDGHVIPSAGAIHARHAPASRSVGHGQYNALRYNANRGYGEGSGGEPRDPVRPPRPLRQYELHRKTELIERAHDAMEEAKARLHAGDVRGSFKLRDQAARALEEAETIERQVGENGERDVDDGTYVGTGEPLAPTRQGPENGGASRGSGSPRTHGKVWLPLEDGYSNGVGRVSREPNPMFPLASGSHFGARADSRDYFGPGSTRQPHQAYDAQGNDGRIGMAPPYPGARGVNKKDASAWKAGEPGWFAWTGL